MFVWTGFFSLKAKAPMYCWVISRYFWNTCKVEVSHEEKMDEMCGGSGMEECLDVRLYGDRIFWPCSDVRMVDANVELKFWWTSCWWFMMPRPPCLVGLVRMCHVCGDRWWF